MGLDGLLILSFLRGHAFVDTLSAADLLQLPREEARAALDRLAQPGTGFLERKGGTRAATFHLTKGVARDLLGKASYTRTRGLDPIRYAEMVRLGCKVGYRAPVGLGRGRGPIATQPVGLG
ncbi:MAG: hypothetical protein ACJ76N_12070 [Thermoanaerobaculia bacterium]